MKPRKFEILKVVSFEGKKYTIMVYGEMSEVKTVNGFYAVPITYNAKNNKIKNVDFEKKSLIPGFNDFYTKTREFNMGWAICSEADEFNHEIGLKLCKRRFSRSPMRTQNGRFLTPDMCMAIVSNEVDYISNNIHMFLPKNTLKKTNDDLDKGCVDTSSVSTYCNPVIGDYVSFESNNSYYVGIFKGFKGDNGVNWNEMFFYAPIDCNGLINHNLSRFFTKISSETNFCMASENEIKLINDYLLGAHGREWDSERQRFKLVVE